MCAAARVIKKIKMKWRVLGMTSVDDELFVLLDRDNNQVAVYSINDYHLLRRLNLPGLKSRDMTSCVRHKCLYMSDEDNSCIQRYHLASSAISKWSVPGSPFGLSVTRKCNLLVVTRPRHDWLTYKPNNVVELSADSGQWVRIVALLSDIEKPCHGVQLTTRLTSKLVVCHSATDEDLHRVCVVGNGGTVKRSYGGQCGSDVGQLDCPCHLAVDKDSQFIFVADQNNNRVVLLSPKLKFVRYISEGLSLPCRLYLHQATRRLFVGQWKEGVTVIQL